MNLPDRVKAIRADYDECFGCGASNPIGLQLGGFRIDSAKVYAGFAPRMDYHGFSGLLHGGVVAAALDEIMAWTAILLEDVMVMTGTLELRYRKPARINTSYTMEGRLEERRGRRLRLAGRMLDGDTLVAEGSGLFLATQDLGEIDPTL